MTDIITADIHNRHKDAEWFDTDNKPVLVGGTGGIGGWLTLLLARAGMMPYIYDFDIVEEHNRGGQLFNNDSVGQNKVDALADIVLDFADVEVNKFNEKVTADTMSNNYVFSCFDNMQARKDLFEAWVESNNDDEGLCVDKKAIFIDGRLSLEMMQIFCVKCNSTTDIDRYRKYLFDDSEVEDAPCTARQTSHAAAMIASHIVSFFVNHLTNIRFSTNKRSVPFFWEYYLPLDMVEYNPEITE